MKIILVMAIGTCFYQRPDFDTRKAQAIQWAYIAQSWLASPREKSRLNTATMQVECLLLLTRSIYNISGDLLWNHTGSVLRTAMSMGFHRDPKHSDSKLYSVLHKEIRRRIWATILEINIQSSLSYGVSPMISVDDYDTEAPSNINDNEIDETTITPPISHPAHIFTQSSLQISLLKSLPARLNVAILVNDYQIEGSYEEVIRLDKELRRHKDDRSFFARAAQNDLGIFRPTTFHRKILDLLVQRFLLILHRPFAVQARNNPRFYYSHKVYLDTAVSIHSVPSNTGSSGSTLSSENLYVDDDYSRFRLISGGFIKEIFIHSVIIIYQEMLRPLEDDLPNFIPEKSSREPYLRLLRDMVDLAHKRIEAGETAVKTYLMYSIALAHIEALEKEASPEEAMIEAGETSLLQCKEILRLKTLCLPNMVPEDFSDKTGVAETAAGDMDMLDWGMDFEPSNSWLFSGWPLNNSRGESSFY